MRLHIFTSPGIEILPFNYQPILTGAFHKWLGENELHGKPSLYSFSWLTGSRTTKSGLKFPNGAYFFISAHHEEVIKNIISGIRQDPIVTRELVVQEITIAEDLKINNITQRTFQCASPILVKRTVDDREIHYTFDDIKSDELLTETLKNKLKEAGLSSDGIAVSFDRSYPHAKTKVAYYKNIGNKANMCPVTIKGTTDQITFAWNVGVGNSTGIGFGALK